MHLSPLETQVNNKDVRFCGKDGTRFIQDKHFSWMNDMNGAEQRAIMGATALVLQPPIDYFNPRTDEKTRKFSVMKTVVKTLVGTGVGVAVRYAGIRYAKYLKKKPEKLKSMVKDIEVKKQLTKIMNDKNKTKTFINQLGTLMGVVAVFISNFTIDMPLAKFAIEKTSLKYNLSADKPKEDKK